MIPRTLGIRTNVFSWTPYPNHMGLGDVLSLQLWQPQLFCPLFPTEDLMREVVHESFFSSLCPKLLDGERAASLMPRCKVMMGLLLAPV